MKVGYAGRSNPLDKSAWSGTYFYTYQAIKKYYPTEIFYYEWPWHVKERLILHKQYQKIIHKKAAVEFLRGYAKYFSKQLKTELLRRKVDILFVPSAPQLIAYCNTDIPVIYMTDATFFQLQGYYPLFADIARYNINQGIAIDKTAFKKAAHCMVTSDWTKQSAITDYNIAPDKISVVLPGANLDIIPPVNELEKKDNKSCRLLFIGVEWERKGGAIVLDTFYALRNRSVPVHLTIIGCLPPVDDKDITVIPFINKNDVKETERLHSIFLRSNFLISPSRAECAGIVFCEAGAYGIPSITTNTGGVNGIVQEGVNGYALPLSAAGKEYADKIEELFKDNEKYHLLCSGSRRRYEETLNWDHWGRTFHDIAENILSK